ncbi:hypothetical protein SAMN05216403_101285 [Nitrosospira multiformis ATCC 25196]|uniref:Uncharacterized protein n=1 Tax=Nitrosospira multiformis (strain ATCC 25196 / NCIMB 11849 / C 71) TaxID=323848 RepID=Q2YBL9_NITMU|nr:hypothetical protein [Nitrosospira multiformis]ABB73852.1 hypothetical protein Nmul_A0544 [Nitrosospira multiformis ATCC 25196]SEF43419.1 hypothetical protein SAMN05216403_101285 [Nitrosospira multiformis ATCC 25196]
MASSKRIRNPKKIRNKQSARQDRIIGEIASAIRMRGHLEIAKLKIQTSVDELFTFFPRIFRQKNALDFVHGPAFPVKPSELFSKPALYQPAGPFNELIWGVCRCLQFSEELKDFTHLREEYERSLLRNSKSKCNEILNVIERKFGCSIWLIQNKIAAAQFWEGIEEARKLGQLYEDECKDHQLMPWIIRFIGKRIEATGLKGYLKTELLRMFGDYSNPILQSYLRAKLFELSHIHTDDVPATLYVEAQSCVIDHYETLVFILQSAARTRAISTGMIPVIEKPLVAIFRRTQDIRLAGVLRGLDIVPSTVTVYNKQRAELIELYTKGEYPLMAQNSETYLRDFPEDMSIQVMRLKACLQAGISYPDQQGVLKEAFRSLHEVLSLSTNTYSAAFALITLSERFYGHSWVHYLEAVTRYELRPEQAAFPPDPLRDIFIREPHVTPFSAVAANGQAKIKILNDEQLKILFPYTRAVYDLVSSGQIDEPLPISEIRKQKYLAVYHLAFGSPIRAAEHFQWLIVNTTGVENIRARGGAALALLKLDRISEAVDTTVAAYIENQNVPTLLPIKQVADALKEPADWPRSISTSLLFQLYTLYCGPEKIAQLRYSFELFQVNNRINEPSDLAERIEEFGKPFVIAYLRNIWTPEIMRHTILYSGTREIEEARIKVCRILAELDPEGEVVYFDEIKERVKQQEIAKGTRLIEQSKVYVEIEAIKKSLKTKLEDSYIRYKSSSQTSVLKPEQSFAKNFITNLGAVFAKENSISVPLALSKIQTLNLNLDMGSESDVQFEALFSEVTNEFLRGDHGLNAYLSTTIRHGTLSNTLRKPVADERLITSREEGSKSYIRNQYWGHGEKGYSEYQAEWQLILDALDTFSSEFDSVIEYLKDELIQIRIVHELKDSGENKNALFVYRSSQWERKFVQEQDKAFTNMDEFVNYYVDILWEKTDLNLRNVQYVLDTDIRARLMEPFVKLTNHLNRVPAPGINDLLNAVGRAKTNVQNQLGLVISWFKRSEVYDRQDCAADFPFHIALNMVKNTMFNATGWNGASVSLSRDTPLMPGRTLDGMVYVFHVLLENAVLRSGLEMDELTVKAELSFSNGVFNARISNNLAPAKVTQAERDKLSKLRDSLRSDESPRRAQREGRSGLHKIWRTINSPIYKEPKLDFYHLEDSFVVEVNFKLEKKDHEYLGH